MAEETIKILKMKDEEYFNLIYNDKVNEFLELHKGWDKVGAEIYHYLNS
ncbi:hypothetical protein SJAV_01500 [Sulfurisphaera javensis]|uniref:Uncharacterized protein n=1 Tax=Sulfurisphaera javensis TaxID=2049879 RepID=A0AAT9GMX5_9CREN